MKAVSAKPVQIAKTTHSTIFRSNMLDFARFVVIAKITNLVPEEQGWELVLEYTIRRLTSSE